MENSTLKKLIMKSLFDSCLIFETETEIQKANGEVFHPSTMSMSKELRSTIKYKWSRGL